MMSPPPEFGTQLIGQTEKTLNAILGRLLAGTGLTEPQWVTLTVAVMSGGSVPPDELASRVAGALKVSDGEAQTRIDELAVAQLLQRPPADGSPVTVTDAGRDLHAGIRASVAEITQRLWGDLPADDLATAARVLGIVLGRANAELAPS
jgi:DNA-binding MarR family transcriptional regulator